MDAELPTRISTRAEFSAALRALLADALQTRTRELWLVDADFALWPLGERDTVELLTRWAQDGVQRRLNLLASHYDEMPRRHPRFVEWRRHWAHLVTARAVADVDASEVPTLLLAGNGLGLHLADKHHLRGHWFRGDGEWRTWREVVDALLQRSSDAFPATSLGL